MSNFWQTVIPAAVTALVAGRVAITRTGRLRKVIRENIDLLGTLPTDHPSRARVEAHIEDLVDRKIRREQRLFEPITPAGSSFGINTAIAVIALLGAILMAAEATGLYHPSELERGDMWWGLGFYASVALFCATLAVRAQREKQQG
jgi:hypothetical protein